MPNRRSRFLGVYCIATMMTGGACGEPDDKVPILLTSDGDELGTPGTVPGSSGDAGDVGTSDEPKPVEAREGATQLPAGTFAMGRCGDAGAGCMDAFDGLSFEVPEHDEVVEAFELDVYEVTVGRYRLFADAYADGFRPSEGDGAHPSLSTTGWQSNWDEYLPADDDGLTRMDDCTDNGWDTWNNNPGAREWYPINCITWFEAFAFCIWDGGRLPTDVEWEYAAAGGDDNRLYPWGQQPPSRDRVNYEDTADSPFVDTGSYVSGVARWGQHNMGGGVNEWVFAWWNETTATNRILRGGHWYSEAQLTRAVGILSLAPENRSSSAGVRCARD